MSDRHEIIRIAAKGDGATADGHHVAGAVPGDWVSDGLLVERGPEHVDPSCPHFGPCGGCQLQHASDRILEGFIRDRVINTAKGQGVLVEECLPVHLSPPNTRRRATLHALRTQDGAVLGYRKQGSHRIVDLTDCSVLQPELFQCVGPLRNLIAAHASKAPVDITLAMADQGIDLEFRNLTLKGLEAIEAVTEFCRTHNLARVSLDQGFGPETVWEPEPLTVNLSGVRVPFPIAAFQQATRDAELQMIADASSWIGEGGPVVDLFAGLGTFAFALAKRRKVLAVEADRAAHLACKAGGAQSGGAVLALHRDLFRNPLTAQELSRFSAALLDPPRAGARQQIKQIAESDLARVVYVSCNPSSWARDAASLVDGGFRLTKARPIGQFRWSTHVELVSVFER